MTKIITIKAYEDMPEGSVFDAVGLVDCHWEGLWGSRAGSYPVSVPADHCEVWDERKHDPFYTAKRVLEEGREREIERLERAQLARLKAKYEK